MYTTQNKLSRVSSKEFSVAFGSRTLKENGKRAENTMLKRCGVDDIAEKFKKASWDGIGMINDNYTRKNLTICRASLLQDCYRVENSRVL